MSEGKHQKRLEAMIGKIILNHQKIRGLVAQASYNMTVEIITPWKLDDKEWNQWRERRGSPLKQIDNAKNFRKIFYQSLSDRYLNLMRARSETASMTDKLLYNEFFQNISVFIETIRAFGKPFDTLETINPEQFPLGTENTLRNHIVHGYFKAYIDDENEVLINFIRSKHNNDTTQAKQKFGKLDFDSGYNTEEATTLFYGNSKLKFKTLETLTKLQEKVITALYQCFIEDTTPFSYLLSNDRLSHSELVKKWESFQRRLCFFKEITEPLREVKLHFEKDNKESPNINLYNSNLPTELLTGDYEPVIDLDIDFD